MHLRALASEASTTASAKTASTALVLVSSTTAVLTAHFVPSCLRLGRDVHLAHIKTACVLATSVPELALRVRLHVACVHSGALALSLSKVPLYHFVRSAHLNLRLSVGLWLSVGLGVHPTCLHLPAARLETRV